MEDEDYFKFMFYFVFMIVLIIYIIFNWENIYIFIMGISYILYIVFGKYMCIYVCINEFIYFEVFRYKIIEFFRWIWIDVLVIFFI